MITQGMGKNQRMISRGMGINNIIRTIIRPFMTFYKAVQARIFKHEDV